MQSYKARCRRDLFVKMLAVTAFILPAGRPAGNSFGTANTACTNPVFTTSDPNGGWSNGGYYVHNNMWNSDAGLGPETLSACSYSNWYVVSNQTNNAGAVKTYPNVHKDYSNVAIDSFNYLTSTFAATSPHVGIYNVAYDIWLNGVASTGCTEVMIWTENFNQVPAGSKVAAATFGGRTYDVWKTSWSWTYIAFVPTVAFTSGSMDLLEIFTWIISQGWIASGSTVGQICFGVEIVSTDGANATFTCTDFSISTTQSTAVIQRTDFPIAAKSPIAENEYFSLSGKRLEFKNSAAGAAKNRIVINRTTGANGAVHAAMMVVK